MLALFIHCVTNQLLCGRHGKHNHLAAQFTKDAVALFFDFFAGSFPFPGKLCFGSGTYFPASGLRPFRRLPDNVRCFCLGIRQDSTCFLFGICTGFSRNPGIFLALGNGIAAFLQHLEDRFIYPCPQDNKYNGKGKNLKNQKAEIETQFIQGILLTRG